MSKTIMMMGCLISAIFISSIACGQFLSPVANLQGTIDTDSMAFFIGKTSISGEFEGYTVDFFEDNPLINEINAIPLFGTTTLNDINSVKIVDIDSLENISSEDITNFDLDIFDSYTNVNIIARQGPFFLGFNESVLSVDSELDFAISSTMNLQIEQDNIPFLALISNSNLNMDYKGEFAVLAQTYENGTITIEDTNGDVLWNRNSSNKLFLIEDKEFLINQESPFYLIPLVETGSDIQLSVTPANLESFDINSLIEEVTTVSQDFGDLSELPDTLRDFEDMVDVITSIVNGGIIFAEIDEMFTIDNSQQKFSSFGFARGEESQITISPASQTTQISGEYKLIFLGDHLYTSQAKDSESGVSFPFVIVVIWIIAIVLFFLFKYYIKKEPKIEFSKRTKQILLIFHIVALIITFILLDREISFQFGSSVFDSLFGQGFTIITGIFAVLQLVMWVLGYLLVAIPVYFIAMYVLKYLDIGKDGKHIGKGVSAFFIWVFCAIYVKLIFNIIFLALNPGNLFQMG